MLPFCHALTHPLFCRCCALLHSYKKMKKHIPENYQISKGTVCGKQSHNTVGKNSNSSHPINSTLSLFHTVPSPFPLVLFVYFSRSNSGPFLRRMETRTSLTFQNGLNPTIKCSDCLSASFLFNNIVGS